jgi:hypothetical protein
MSKAHGGQDVYKRGRTGKQVVGVAAKALADSAVSTK